MKKNLGRILTGAALVILAVAIILGSLGIGFEFPAGIEVWQWVVGIVLLLALFDSIRRLEFVGTFLMLGFEVMVFEPQLGIIFGFADENWISNWLIFLVSILLGIGVSMMVKGFKLFNIRVKKNTLGHTIKYIDCTDIKNDTVYNKMGDLEIRFENLCNFDKDATVTIRNTLGETRVYVPSNWNVKTNLVNSLGEINIDSTFKSGEKMNDGKPVLTLKLYNKLGEIRVIGQ